MAWRMKCNPCQHPACVMQHRVVLVSTLRSSTNIKWGSPSITFHCIYDSLCVCCDPACSIVNSYCWWLQCCPRSCWSDWCGQCDLLSDNEEVIPAIVQCNALLQLEARDTLAGVGSMNQHLQTLVWLLKWAAWGLTWCQACVLPPKHCCSILAIVFSLYAMNVRYEKRGKRNSFV